ncbi:peptidase [Streptomyces sp. NPDC000594]|uniref:peptidase n=1 Tax=Streptomyces sp. NPDC000594 TaxID=3154261 RepID=UPI0033257B3B
MALEEVRPETVDLGGVETIAEPLLTTRSAKRYPVAPGHRVNVRSGPGTGYDVVRVLAYNARVPINCQKTGERVSGPYGTTNIWDCIGSGEFISDAYVQTGSDGYVAIRCS